MSENLPIKAVLFDIDGTLVDSLPMLIPGLADTFEHFNGYRPTDQEIRAIIGRPLREQLKMFRDEPPTAEGIAEMTQFTFDRFSAYEHLEQEFAPAIDALEMCKRGGLKTALVTSKSTFEITAFLQRFRGTPFCDATVCASDVHDPKPAPESALLACRKLDIAPGEGIMIGDSVFDLQCGRAAGTLVGAVLYGSGVPKELRAHHPDLIFETPNDLRSWAATTIDSTCLGKK